MTSRRLLARPRAAPHEAHHLGIREDPGQLVEVVLDVGPQQQPLGAQRVDEPGRHEKKAGAGLRPAPAVVAYACFRRSMTRTALPSERWMVFGSLSLTAAWMLSTL